MDVCDNCHHPAVEHHIHCIHRNKHCKPDEDDPCGCMAYAKPVPQPPPGWEYQ